MTPSRISVRTLGQVVAVELHVVNARAGACGPDRCRAGRLQDRLRCAGVEKGRVEFPPAARYASAAIFRRGLWPTSP
jgi:hypothetical protein